MNIITDLALHLPGFLPELPCIMSSITDFDIVVICTDASCSSSCPRHLRAIGKCMRCVSCSPDASFCPKHKHVYCEFGRSYSLTSELAHADHVKQNAMIRDALLQMLPHFPESLA